MASHQIVAAIASAVAGIVRDTIGQHTMAWVGAAALGAVAAALSFGIRRGRASTLRYAE